MDDQAPVILDALKKGLFVLSIHAAQRMAGRSITMADIRACAQTTRSFVLQAQTGTFRIEGEDLDGEPLTVICGLDRNVVIVTVF